MQKAIIAVLFCVALSSVALAVESPQVLAFIESSQSSDFGKTLMATIEMQLTEGSPGDYLVNLLNKLTATILNDITIANKTHNAYQTKCKNELGQLTTEIRRHAQAVLESKKLITQASKTRAWSENDRESKTRQLKEAQANYHKIKEIRKAEAAAYTQKINEINNALKTLHAGKNLLEKNLKSKPVLVEVSSTFRSYVAAMASELNSAEYKGRGYVSVVEFIASLLEKAAIQANQGSVNKILEMIQKVIDQLESTKNWENKAEAERIANFGELKNIYKRSIDALKSSIAKSTAVINTLTNTIRYNKNRIAENTRSIRVKGRQKIKTKKACQGEDRIFNKENKKRMSDYNLLQQAVALIHDHIDDFRSIVLAKAKANIESKLGKK